MSTRIRSAPLPGEQIVAVDPQLQQRVMTTWQRRLRMFSGRALSDVALSAEQDYRSGHLSHSGRLLTPGVASGLGLGFDLSGDEPMLVLGSGQGIASSGEDVTVPISVRIPLKGISVFNPQTQSAVPADTGPQTAISQNFGAYTAANPTAPRVGLFLLQPIAIKFAGNPAGSATDVLDITAQVLTSPDRDPDEYAFEDWQTMDGCRLIFYPWPAQKIPLPTAGVFFRNWLANAVFTLEASFGRGDSFPWDEAGVALGVAVFDDKWKPLFLDSSSVVRAGGLPRRVPDAPFQQTWRAQNPLLAEARIQQFLEHQATLPAGNPIAALADNFQYLPPIGILPTTAFDLANFPVFKNHAFPANYTVSAEPVIADEMEDYLAQSAELASYDLHVADAVQVLVPVAQNDYDPALLLQEQVDPEFTNEMADATKNRIAALQHRSDLGAKADVMLRALATPVPKSALLNLDADLTPDEKADLGTAKPYVAPEKEGFGTEMGKDETGKDVLISSDLNNLKKALAAPRVPVTPTSTTGPLIPEKDDASVAPADRVDIQTLDEGGLQQFIDRLQKRIKSANDLIDLGFLRAQTDIYRYRQGVMSSADATRLATSPVLAQIAQGTNAATTTAQIQDYFQQTLAKPASTPSAPAPPPKPTIQQDPSKVSPPPPRVLSYNQPAFHPLVSRVAPGVFRPTARPVTMTAASRGARSLALNRVYVPPRPPVVKPPVVTVSPAHPVSALHPVAPPSPTAHAVQTQAPLVGAQLDLRHVSVAERLKQPPSQEALFFTAHNRADMTQSILNCLPPAMVDDLPIQSIEVTDDPNNKTVDTVTRTLGDIRSGNWPISKLQVPSLYTDPDEGLVFSAGIQLLEQHTALLRQLEGRVADYNNILTLCQQTLSAIHSNLDEIDGSLKAVEDKVNNARHVYTFTQALFQDEQTRVARVNARRAAVLQHNVPFVVFRRPPSAVATLSEPARQLFPDIAGALLPACLNRTAPVPPELRQMVNLIRQAPAKWLPEAISVLPKFEQRELVQALAARMQMYAQLAKQTPPVSSISYNQSVYSDKINLAYSGQCRAMEVYRSERASFTSTSFRSLAWSAQVNLLLPVISVGDLLNSDQGNQIIRQLARLLEEITGVAACIYDRASQALPAIRLSWAEAFYQESDSADLHDLSVLPNWGQVQYEQRRELQMLVSWLFGQIDSELAEARHFMNDVIRVAILLASDAPVSEIIAGTCLAAAPLKVGVSIRSNLASLRIHHSMFATIHDRGELIAHGVVDDLSETEASVQITAVVKDGVSSVPVGATIQYATHSSWENSVNTVSVTRTPVAIVRRTPARPQTPAHPQIPHTPVHPQPAPRPQVPVHRQTPARPHTPARPKVVVKRKPR